MAMNDKATSVSLPRLDRELLAAAVLVARKDQKRTLDELSVLTDVSRATLCRVEAATHAPSCEVLIRILDWLDSTLEDFVIRGDA